MTNVGHLHQQNVSQLYQQCGSIKLTKLMSQNDANHLDQQMWVTHFYKCINFQTGFVNSNKIVSYSKRSCVKRACLNILCHLLPFLLNIFTVIYIYHLDCTYLTRI